MSHASIRSHRIDLDEMPDTRLLTEAEAASVLGLAPGTLAVWRCTGRYDLAYVRVGRRIRYRVGDLRAFLERRTQTHTGCSRSDR